MSIIVLFYFYYNSIIGTKNTKIYLDIIDISQIEANITVSATEHMSTEGEYMSIATEHNSLQNYQNRTYQHRTPKNRT